MGMWNHRGIDIGVNRAGQFTFEEKSGDGGLLTHTAPSLEAAKLKIEAYLKQGKPKDLDLGCVVVLMEEKPGKAPFYTIKEYTITGVNGNTGKLRFKPTLDPDDIHYGPFPKSENSQSYAVEGDLMQYVKLMVELDQLRTGLARYSIPDQYSYGRIDAGNLPGKTDELIRDYYLAKNGKGLGRMRRR